MSNRLVFQAYVDDNKEALTSLHQILEKINRIEFSSAKLDDVGCERKPIISDISSILESATLNYETSKMRL